MNITFKQLRAFVSVVETGSFTDAAATLHASQSATSLMIKALEAELGLRLFDRTTRRVALSDAGREFIPLALKVLDDVRALQQSATDLTLLKHAVLRICATEAVACSLLTTAIAGYAQQRPGVEVRLIDTLSQVMFETLRNGEADLLIGPMSAAEANADLDTEPLFESPMRAWFNAGHALARQAHVSAETLLGHALIVPSLDFTTRFLPRLRDHLGEQVVERALAAAPTAPRQVTNLVTGFSLAQVGLGVVVAADYIGPLARNFGLQSCPLVRPAMTRVVAMYRRSKQTQSPAAQDFADYLREFLSQRGLRYPLH